MDDQKWARIASLGGIAFAVLNVIAVVIGGSPPSITASNAKISKYFAEHAHGIQAGALLAGLATIGLLWWFGTLWRMMVDAEDGRARLAVTAAIGLAISGACALLSTGLGSLVAMRLESFGTSVKVMYTAMFVTISLSDFGTVAFIAAVSALAYRTGMLARWIVVVGWLASLAMLVGAGGAGSPRMALYLGSFVGLLLWIVWIVAISLKMWRGEPAPASS